MLEAEMDKEKILKGLGNQYISKSTKDLLLDRLIEMEIKETVGKPGYETLTRYYGQGEGLRFIRSYVRNLVQKEGFGVGSAVTQFESNF